MKHRGHAKNSNQLEITVGSSWRILGCQIGIFFFSPGAPKKPTNPISQRPPPGRKVKGMIIFEDKRDGTVAATARQAAVECRQSVECLQPSRQTTPGGSVSLGSKLRKQKSFNVCSSQQRVCNLSLNLKEKTRNLLASEPLLWRMFCQIQ